MWSATTKIWDAYMLDSKGHVKMNEQQLNGTNYAINNFFLHSDRLCIIILVCVIFLRRVYSLFRVPYFTESFLMFNFFVLTCQSKS